ncbi:MAG TPA: hypothetical protein VE732_04170 [Nitrososphaera sp.]|nr:hypothetical protein [Nitrososphaera sp.]
MGFGEVAPQCYCSKGRDYKPKENDNERRVDPCCRPEQPVYIGYYYQTLHRQIKDSIAMLPSGRPDYVGGFFYWYFYQDATDQSTASGEVLDALVESAKAWRQWLSVRPNQFQLGSS